MRTITQHFGIQGNVPFLDLEVDGDNLIFLDLHAVRLSEGPDPYRDHALASADCFLEEIVDAILDGTPERIEYARTLSSGFHEPWQTRMGMAVAGFFGRGGSVGVGDALVETLTEDPKAFAVVGILKHLEQIPLFVEGVGADICSDLTTRVIFASLVEFTSEMMDRFPELKVGSGPTNARMWDVVNCRWVDRNVVLPAPGGRPLLLVPDGWARRNPLMTASRFHGVAVLDYIQAVEAVYSSRTQTVIKTPKRVLSKREDLRQIRIANIRTTLRALEDGHDLLAAFEAYLADWYLRQKNVAA